MCFSAEASFTGAAVLGVMGTYIVRQTSNRQFLWLACIPLLFAFQQLIEGFIWLTAEQPDLFKHFVGLEGLEKDLFLFFALLVWPIWIPFSIYMAESDPRRKQLLGLFLLGGIAYNMLYLWNLTTVWSIQNPSVQIMDHSIQYNIHINYLLITRFFYVLLTIIPPFISSLRYMELFAVANCLALAIAYYFYEVTVISVWCFFGAWVSLCLYFILQKNKQTVAV